VRRLADGAFTQGAHTAHWDGTDERGRSVPSGTYFARLRDGTGAVETSGLVLVR
jgi:flagellar hook assembly protein FlgD